jgi:anti-sigma B factor antagonist
MIRAARRRERGASTLSVEVRKRDDGITIVSLSGEWDAYLAPRLKETLEDVTSEPSPRIVLNLLGCQFFDSTILGLMIGSAKRVGEANGAQAVACDRSILLKVFDNSGTSEMLGVVPTEEEAIAKLAAAGKPEQGGEADGDPTECG